MEEENISFTSSHVAINNRREAQNLKEHRLRRLMHKRFHLTFKESIIFNKVGSSKDTKKHKLTDLYLKER